MTNSIWAIGPNYTQHQSNIVVLQSPDGVVWENPTTPFSINQSAQCIAYGNVNSVTSLVAINVLGNVAISTDFSTWQSTAILYNEFYTPVSMNITFDKITTAGILNENATIASSNDGINWSTVYSGNVSPSCLYSIKYIAPTGIWIATGQENGNPLVVYSSDTVTWTQLSVPAQFNGFIFYDVDYFDDYYYFSSNNYIINLNGILSNVWGASSELTSTYGATNFSKISINDEGVAVAISSGALYSSTDRSIWTKFEYPGYSFASVTYYNNQWLVGTYSTLSQYTLFTSSDAINWTPSNNGIQPFSFTQS